jgi:hypothetical protein
MEISMHRMLTLAALTVLLGTVAPVQAADAPDATSQTPILVGAYAPAPADAPLVQDARNLAQTRMPALAQVQVDTAYTQVVKGLNVKLICTAMAEGRQQSWKFVVYRDLDGRMELTLAELL